MCIPPFFCGIGFTIGVEIVIAVILAIYGDKKASKPKK